ncbi:MAG TPA: multicopper oxidase family protein [Saprospiraceae bacterium]|nr:multicopper oxidase family protein [Saprospiraceae bacterium]
MKRRKFFYHTGTGALTALAGGSAMLSLVSCGMDDNSMVNMGEAPEVAEGLFTTALPMPPVVVSPVLLKAQPVNAVLKAGINTAALGYQEQGILGPTIEIVSGENFQANFQNALSESSNIHWHGLMTPADMDGHPADVIQPGQNYTYSFPINNRAGMYWYHPHPDEATAKQAYLGLAGLFKVTDGEEQALGLPSGDFEIPIVIQDKLMKNTTALSYVPSGSDVMNGLLGDHVLVNGVHAPFKNVGTRKYRLRVLNGSNGRIYNLALSNGNSFVVIGGDGGLLAAPKIASSIILSPGERVDVLVDFSGLELNAEIYLVSETFSGGAYQGKQSFKVLKFVVNQMVSDSYIIPSILSSYAVISESQSTRTRAFDISNGGGHGGHGGGIMMHTINGKSYSESRIDETIVAGATEIWTFDNTEGIDPHPMHLHGAIFQVLDRTGGRSQVFAHELGWKDTVLVMPGEKVRTIVQFGLDKGVFVFHCHNLEHEDSGMMLQMEIV